MKKNLSFYFIFFIHFLKSLEIDNQCINVVSITGIEKTINIIKTIDEPKFICFEGTLPNGNIVIACFKNEEQKNLFVCTSNKQYGESLIHVEKSVNPFLDYKKIEMLFNKQKESCIIS